MERDKSQIVALEVTINFNSHAHVERDPSVSAEKSTSMYFNSHAHVERDVFFGKPFRLNNISTHTLTWSVTAQSWTIMPSLAISTHTLTWSVTRKPPIYAIRRNHFNSHAHVERDIYSCIAHRLLLISTHTLTWSVTNRLNVTAALMEISTHTLTWSVTSDTCGVVSTCVFQLTRSRGA